jgi:DNA-binding HxlR family transcriptional regulator
MLALRLRELEEAGVLIRLPLRHNTRAYALTDRGRALRAAIVALGRWGRDEAPTRPGQDADAARND